MRKKALLLLLLLAGPCWCEEVWVQGKRFTGAQVGRREEIFVDAKAFCQFLELPCSQHGRSLYLGPLPEGAEETADGNVSEVLIRNQSIAFQPGPKGEILINLKSSVEALGAVCSRNTAMDSVDVHLSASARKLLNDPGAASTEPAPSVSTAATPAVGTEAGPRSVRTNNWQNLVVEYDQTSQLFGYKSARGGQWAIQPQFVEANEFNFGLAAARECLSTRTEHRNHYVIVGGDFNKSDQSKLEQLSSKDRKTYNQGKYTVKHHNAGKIGFINSSGEWIIKPQYDSARAFFVDSAGRTRALVTLGSKSVYIDTRGRVLNL